MKIRFIILFIIFLFGTKLFSYNWEIIKGPNYHKYISALETYESTIYISLYEKLFKTNDFGKKWEEIQFNDELSFSQINQIIVNNSNIFVRSPLPKMGNYFELSVSKIEANKWNEIYNEHLPINYLFISKNDEDIYSAFLAKSDSDSYSKNHLEVKKFNKETNYWEDFLDSLSLAQLISSPKTLFFYNYKIIFGTRITIYSGEVIKRPNIQIFDTKNKTVEKILDTVSGIWKSYINCFIEKDGILFTGTSTGVYKSTNEGYLWERKSEGLHYKDANYDYDFEIHRMMVFEGNIYAIATPPTSAGNFYPTNTRLVFSTNNGENWKFADNFQEEWPQDFSLLNGKIILSTYNGIFETDKTLTKKVSLLNDTLNSGVVLDFCFQNNKLYASNYKRFLSVTSDNGNHWVSLINDSMLKDAIITKMFIKDSLYFLSNNSTAFLVTTDSGKTYNYKKEIDGLKNTKVFSIFVDEKDIVYVGTRYGVYFSTNKGASWEKLTPPELDVSIMSIEKVGDFLFIGTTDFGIFKFNLIYKTVNQLTIPKKYPEITVKEIKFIKNKLYLGTKVYANSLEGITVNGEGIFVSSDLGLTWEKRNTGLPDSCETINIVHYSDYIFAGMSNYGGVYYSSDEGLNWFPLNRGYSGLTLNRLRVFGDYLYCATSTGLYKLNLKEWINGVDEVERKNYLYNYPPYPNPATNQVSAIIYWDLALDINSADIKIYDVYGNQVADKSSTTLEEQGPYYGKLTWHCKGVPPGVYLISISYGTEKKTIKVCVVE